MRPADADALRAFLGRVALRLWWIAAAEGAAFGLLIATGFLLLGLPTRQSGITPLLFGIGIAITAAVARAMVSATRTAGGLTPAARVERAAPESRNLILTAYELATDVGAPTLLAATPVRSYVAEAIGRDAAALVTRLDPARLFPLSRSAATIGGVTIAWIAALALATGGNVAGRTVTSVPTLDAVQITVVPPEYTGGAERTVRNPERVEALAGSILRVRAESNAATIGITTLDFDRAYTTNADGSISIDLPATVDGFITLEPRLLDGTAGDRRMIGITVTADAPPRPRITAPGRDLIVPNGDRSIDIALDAADDLGLTSLKLRYTRVVGSGERFSFTEGDVPLTLVRRNAREWSASVKWELAALKLEPGDMVVYRAAATDARPGSQPVESDAFIVEIATPGGVAAAGFALDPEEERYALSQQMIVLKTQRLIALRPVPAPDSLSRMASEIAAEQRRVRAEFVFMMGGEFSDAGAGDSSMTELSEEEEEEHAAEEAAAGRQLNAGRVALLRAVRSMSLAARELDEGRLTTALGHERDAVKNLEDAFARNRILLRAFPEREQLDPARRLSGELAGLANVPRTRLAAEPTEAARALSELLPRIAALAAAPVGAEASPGEASRIGEAVLRADPGSRALQAAAKSLGEASSAFRAGRLAEAHRALDRAASTITESLGGALPRVAPERSAVQGTVQGRSANGALVDFLKRSRP